MTAERLLQEFRSRRVPMAIVVDEYGGASGMVTPNDVVGAIMGDFIEEGESDLVALPGGAYDVDGTVPLEEIEDLLKMSLDENSVHTLAGFLMEKLGRMPKVGDRVLYKNYRFDVLEMLGPKVGRVRIQAHVNVSSKNASASFSGL
jgi:CBS domain containing-hemolysin-like protein